MSAKRLWLANDLFEAEVSLARLRSEGFRVSEVLGNTITGLRHLAVSSGFWCDIPEDEYDEARASLDTDVAL